MTYIEPKIYELPTPGQHVGVLAEEIDLGTVNTIFGPKDQCKLVFLVDENGSDGKPLEVHVRATKSRDRRSNLYDYVEALCSPRPIAPDDWELSRHVGKNIALNLIHVRKDGDDRTFCNVKNIFPLPKASPRLVIPRDYVHKAEKDHSFASGFPEPEPAPPAAPSFPATTKPKIVAAPTSSAIRATAVRTKLNRRDKGVTFQAGQTDEEGAEESAPLG
jgi:hypothetical protein